MHDAARAELQSAVDQLRAALVAAEEGETEIHRSFRDRLSRATEQLERSHPRLTEAAGRVLNALSDLGI